MRRRSRPTSLAQSFAWGLLFSAGCLSQHMSSGVAIQPTHAPTAGDADGNANGPDAAVGGGPGAATQPADATTVAGADGSGNGPDAAAGGGPGASTRDVPTDLKLWYAAPATTWQDRALAIGNGRLGAMVFGGMQQERIQFNEDSLWVGDEKDTGAYQSFGDVALKFSHADGQSYRRELDIGRAVLTVTYASGGVQYRREYFASFPAHVIVVRFTADRPGAYTGSVSLSDAHGRTSSAAGHELSFAGSLAGYVPTGMTVSFAQALDYEARIAVSTEGGIQTASGDQIHLDAVDAFTLLLDAGTNYKPQRSAGWHGDPPHAAIAARLQRAAGTPYGQLVAEHVTDYQALLGRALLDLGPSPSSVRALATDDRLKQYKTSAAPADPELEALLFQFGRYLLISSSRPGDLPANLQGVWNSNNAPPWRSDYHADINVQMNYWLADSTNLAEAFLPYADWLEAIREVRRAETNATFHRRGWLMHAENGIFGGSTWQWIDGASAWCAQGLWDHYAFTQDRAFLADHAYPILKELSQYWEDALKAQPDGTLVCPNGYSPESGPHEDGVSFEQEVVWELFTNYMEAADALGVDRDYRDKIPTLRDHLLVPKIGSWGQLQEWMVDRDKPTDTNRHLSHLVGLFPGRQISPLTTPALAAAAKVSLAARGDSSTGWAEVWRAAGWARLRDGAHAYKLLNLWLAGRV